MNELSNAPGKLSPQGALMALMADDPDLITVLLLLPAAIVAGALFGVMWQNVLHNISRRSQASPSSPEKIRARHGRRRDEFCAINTGA
jgi:hypothetical protein